MSPNGFPRYCRKRINTRQKGKRNELKARKYYESLGYDVEVVRFDKWSKNKDYFGLWDLICIGQNGVILAQVKTNTKPNGKWLDEASKWLEGKTPTIKGQYLVYKDRQRGLKPTIISQYTKESYDIGYIGDCHKKKWLVL